MGTKAFIAMIDLSKLSEPELKQLCRETLAPHFRMVGDADSDYPEVVHFHTGRIFKPDFICFPNKQHRLSGWPDWMFYIEVKDALGGNQGSRITEVAWQAKNYNDCICKFRLPAFTLVFPNFAVFIKQEEPAFKAYAEWFSGYMQRERVGELFLHPGGGFKIKFSSSVLYDSKDGRSNFHLLDRQHRYCSQ